ncbi:OmpA family protein [Flagellimonas zhangzhouensis]|uniref:Outer membrane protein OmpA and related peptidoglycan-associated (Lipo)proteins n=1 Tax=Flagellimonas zhangzhouensis TaxID=1073328 RepID=A0A1H2SU52_9FLAO|nr:OmpA family protein [Allomuricauda zhangzhouensis]SDQ78740.1 WD40-like Beta Propeller Repeat [Allomuricauda zhangzhouensis]SDW34564.1 Outer membrane protein OmpA and related peptidoglycan-associated (lipo)proteins [Allomuricauda zhangzhouensis]
MKTKYIPIISLFLLTLTAWAQNPKIKKANEEFDNYAYIDARKIYLNIVKDGYQSVQVFKKLADTYYFNSEYIEAVEWYNRLLMNYPEAMETDYYYRYAQSLKSIDQYAAASKMMEKYRESIQNSLGSNYSLNALLDSTETTYDIINATESLGSSDFGPSFYGEKIVYASASKNTKGSKTDEWTGLPFLDLFEAEKDSLGKLKNPIALRGNINTPYHESSTAFTKDGETVYFTRNNYLNGKKRRGKNRLIGLKIYKAEKNTKGEWTNIKELPFNSDSYSVAHPTLSIDEKRLYFSSNMPGTLGKSDIWYVDILGGDNYSKPVNLGNTINTIERESFPFISETNNLYFSSDGHVGLGGLDIFVVSLNIKGNFSEVANLKKPLNTNQDDFGFIINETLNSGYFSSNRDGEDGSVSDDIYAFYESCNVTIEGLVTDAITGSPVSGANVTLIDDKNNPIDNQQTSETGTYSFPVNVDCLKQYAIRVSNETKKYLPTETTLTTPQGKNALQVNIQLVPPDCPPEDLGCRLDLQPIYFDYGKFNIRPDAEVELAKILQALKEYPQLKIHIESHTDSRSSSSFNLKLSENRARSTRNWLIEHGIQSNRLTAKGYGETQLLNHCSNGVKCSEEEHQLNRRSMFIIKN